ncbi:hypothetical protein GCM10027416_10580 [Okibacterium endophyticum]
MGAITMTPITMIAIISAENPENRMLFSQLPCSPLDDAREVRGERADAARASAARLR